jgi:hypothetical protein
VTAPRSGATATSCRVTAADITTAGHGGQICTVTGPIGSCTLTGLTDGDTCTFTATATGAGGTSPPPSVASTTLVPAPAVTTVAITYPSAGGGTYTY